MDWQKASEELRRKLDPTHVKGRKQGGTTVQYVEGWHAIAEANRIFGFDGWTRETIELRQLGDPREVDGKIRVEYLARVRVTVDGVVRDGCGFGQGIDRDVGQAHESALKEAETDAMKRALMTFGNPFGLALYDKTRENVGVEPRPADVRDRIKTAISKAANVETLDRMWKHPATCEAFASLPEPMQAELTRAYSDRTAQVCQAPAEDPKAHVYG
jgi:DNA repair and recombination protein RAD52